MLSGLAVNAQTITTNARLNPVQPDTSTKVNSVSASPTITSGQKQAAQIPATPQPEAPVSNGTKPAVQSTKREGGR